MKRRNASLIELGALHHIFLPLLRQPQNRGALTARLAGLGLDLK